MSSFGETLRRERELRRISLREISESTKINVRYLEALERNEFTHLPGGAFTKGFIRAYVRYIGADETELINAYLYEIKHQHGDIDDPIGKLSEHYQIQSDDEDRHTSRSKLVLVGWIVGGLVLVTLGVFAYDYFAGGQALIERLFGTNP